MAQLRGLYKIVVPGMYLGRLQVSPFGIGRDSSLSGSLVMAGQVLEKNDSIRHDPNLRFGGWGRARMSSGAGK